MSFFTFMVGFTLPCIVGMVVGMSIHEIGHWLPLKAFGYDPEVILPSWDGKRLTAAVRYPDDVESAHGVEHLLFVHAFLSW